MKILIIEQFKNLVDRNTETQRLGERELNVPRVHMQLEILRSNKGETDGIQRRVMSVEITFFMCSRST